jgi:4-amino-4-deoxy-L-arabinose transferase-like glycosyltransferase
VVLIVNSDELAGSRSRRARTGRWLTIIVLALFVVVPAGIAKAASIDVTPSRLLPATGETTVLVEGVGFTPNQPRGTTAVHFGSALARQVRWSRTAK